MRVSAGALVGLAGAALLAGFASGPARSTDAREVLAGRASGPSAKGDRAFAPQPGRALSRVSSVELVGLKETTVILRDRDGTVVFQSDPVTNTTLVGKDADIPTVTVKMAVDSAPVRQPARRKESKEQPERQPKRSMPVGCEGVVSVLVDGDSRRVPGLCLSQAELNRHS